MTNIKFPIGEGPEIKITTKLVEKPDLTLLDTGFLKGLSYVMMDGAKQPNREIDAWKHLSFDQAMKRVASAYRHLMDVKDGNFFDMDSGLQNADHLAANAMILRYHVEKYIKEKNNETLD